MGDFLVFTKARINEVLENYAIAYNLTTKIRATDLLRHIPGKLNQRTLLTQSIAEHNLMTAALLEFIWLEFSKNIGRRGFDLDPIYMSFMASHHDFDEAIDGDLVPSLCYGCTTAEAKTASSTKTMQRLYGKRPNNFALRAYDEYEARKTFTAQIVKVGDILELFCHNRILLNFGLGVITDETCQNFLPEIQNESKHFLELFGRETSVAEILEHIYAETYEGYDFPPILDEMFASFKSAICKFNFRQFIGFSELP